MLNGLSLKKKTTRKLTNILTNGYKETTGNMWERFARTWFERVHALEIWIGLLVIIYYHGSSTEWKIGFGILNLVWYIVEGEKKVAHLPQ